MMDATPTLAPLHELVSLIGIGAGFVVAIGLLKDKRLDAWTILLLVTNAATRYVDRLPGGWRRTYVIAAMTAQYLNVFVLNVQSFLKVPALAFAPTKAAPPSATHLVVFVLSIVLPMCAVLRFRDEPACAR